MLYKQCLLENDGSVSIGWLEADKAKKGYRVTLKDSDDENKWWTILEVYQTTLAKHEIKDAHTSRKWFDNDLKRGTLNKISF